MRIEGHDRAGLERLLRYCARPPFALERLEQLAHDQLVYRSPKPLPDGRTELRLTPPPPMPNAADAWHAPTHSPARYLWAVLLARIYELLPLRCALCGAQMRLIDDHCALG